MSPVDAVCQALRLSDSEKCLKVATHANGNFCWLHSKQVFGLYKGYKRRNARLDALDADPPPYFSTTKTPLANDSFTTIQDETTLRAVYAHLFEKYALLGRVVNARKLHHKHFYSHQFDFGHQAYLDKLSSQRHLTLLALERIEKRRVAILYQKETWFTWAQAAQEEEETRREKEQKKIKHEAALFKRHQKQVHVKLQAIRKQEEQAQEDESLEKAYQQRQAEISEEMAEYLDEDSMWDPIEDVDLERRLQYIDLIYFFLWMVIPAVGEDLVAATTESMANLATPTAPEAISADVAPTKKPKKKSASARQQMNKAGAASTRSNVSTTNRGQAKLLKLLQQDLHQAKDDEETEPDKTNIETEVEMRARLKQGVKKTYEEYASVRLVGSLENPHETNERTAPMTEAEVDEAIADVREIKIYLFCRLVFAQATTLPAALRASSVEAFLGDDELTDNDLRDLCLKLEKPTLQDIRDACADFSRRFDPDEDVNVSAAAETEANAQETKELFEELLDEAIIDQNRYRHLKGNNWLKEKLLYVAQQGKFRPTNRTKISICGMDIWNHASEKAMSRDGWLQFSIIAKDCQLHQAIELCRHWAEFSQLILLTHWQFFPASDWVTWGDDVFLRRLQSLGFFPYFVDVDAQQFSHRFQVGGRSQLRRQHDVVETRNILVGQMKRHDPVTRRFLQYLCMRTGYLNVLVRDGKTGKVITAPPKEQLWTLRQKQGLGRASKNEWQNVLEVGPSYFQRLDYLRRWRLGFDDFYEVYIWDFTPSQTAASIYNFVLTELLMAYRAKEPRDMYLYMQPLMQQLTRDRVTMRSRPIKPGEAANSLWDDVSDERTQMKLFSISNDGKTRTVQTGDGIHPYMFYNEANVAEDKVLFPDEDLLRPGQEVAFRELRNGVRDMENGLVAEKVESLRTIAESLARSFTFANTGGDEEETLASRWLIDDKTDDQIEETLDGEIQIADLKADEDDHDDERFTIASLAPQKLWSGAHELFLQACPRESEPRRALRQAGLEIPAGVALAQMNPQEMMERQRSADFKRTWHEGDLEPDATIHFTQATDVIQELLNSKDVYGSPIEWISFITKIFITLQLRADSKDYAEDPHAPWPHSFLAADMTRAYMTMALFFPDLDGLTAPATSFLQTKEQFDFVNSGLFDLKQRISKIPDRRSRTSYRHRDKDFHKDWVEFRKRCEAKDLVLSEQYPMEWSVIVRPIIAHLYRSGVIAPYNMEPDVANLPGFATVATESHRPNKPDLFIAYEDLYHHFNIQFPPNFDEPTSWPQFKPLVEAFDREHQPAGTARFALLRLWSAPHFYPLMVAPYNRQNLSFLDSLERPWEWKFVPKDMPGSESSAHFVVKRRLDEIRSRLLTKTSSKPNKRAGCQLESIPDKQLLSGDKFVNRGDLILVMGEDETDLLRHCTVVTFALQTKPWLREVDLWKSFVNVSANFIRQMDNSWLE